MKVVFYTSYDKYLLQALRESAFDFLLKPFSAEDLKVVIDRYRKAVRSAVVVPPSFASSIIALMPQQGMFMISTVTGFKLLRLEEIGGYRQLFAGFRTNQSIGHCECKLSGYDRWKVLPTLSAFPR